ncbi:hypothetical protein [Microtetraspora malaysiensis]|uniref:Uncharacterized protein n=1 Tax=Microtetraspora malaysiensis TaxID=161358 RepID=A0ABW6T0E2_9ACTN
MRTRRGTTRSAVAAVLPKLVLLASVLLGVGLSQATAHLCGMPMAGSPLSHGPMHGPMHDMVVAPAERHAPHGPMAAPPIASAHRVAATVTATMAATVAEARIGAAHQVAASQTEGAGEAAPFVLCLTAVAAVLAAAVLSLVFRCRSSGGVTAGSERPSRLPAVRGSPPSFALSLRRVTVLRV